MATLPPQVPTGLERRAPPQYIPLSKKKRDPSVSGFQVTSVEPDPTYMSQPGFAPPREGFTTGPVTIRRTDERGNVIEQVADPTSALAMLGLLPPQKKQAADLSPVTGPAGASPTPDPAWMAGFSPPPAISEELTQMMMALDPTGALLELLQMSQGMSNVAVPRTPRMRFG